MTTYSFNGTQLSPAQRVFFFIFSWLFVLVGAFCLVDGGKEIYRAKASLTWPVADGIIQNSSVKYHHNDKGQSEYSAEVLYQFTVNGTTHTGTQVAFGDYSSNNSSHAQSIVDRYPKGSAVSVHFLPTDPDVCVLETGIKLQAWALPIFGVVFFAVGIFLTIFVPRMIKKQAY